jgi:hypothetical protein
VHLCSSTGTSTLQICFPIATNRRIIWSLLINSVVAQRRPSHHLHFYSHDDVPNAFGISHVHLVLSHRHVLTQQIAFTSNNHLDFSLTSWRRPSLHSCLCLRQEPRTLLGAFSQVCKLRERLHKLLCSTSHRFVAGGCLP